MAFRLSSSGIVLTRTFVGPHPPLGCIPQGFLFSLQGLPDIKLTVCFTTRRAWSVRCQQEGARELSAITLENEGLSIFTLVGYSREKMETVHLIDAAYFVLSFLLCTGDTSQEQDNKPCPAGVCRLVCNSVTYSGT